MIRKIFLLVLLFLLASCRQYSPLNMLSSEKKLSLLVELKTESLINPSVNNQSQPTLFCVFVVKDKDWTPSTLYQGVPCDEKNSKNENVVFYKEMTVVSNKTYDIKSDIIYKKKDGNELWLVAAANFQQISNFKPTAKILLNKKKSKLRIPVEIINNRVTLPSRSSNILIVLLDSTLLVSAKNERLF